MKKQFFRVLAGGMMMVLLFSACAVKEETQTAAAAAPEQSTGTEAGTEASVTAAEPEETLEAASEAPEEEINIRIGVINGPTGMGAVRMMDKAERGEYGMYSFQLSSDGADIVARLANGDLTIGALPTNTAVNLYHKTGGGFRMIAINCLGVLYLLENGNTVQSMADLRGKTVLCNGKGANPEYMINYLLRQNGLEPGKDVTLKFMDPSDISAKMVSGEAEVCMLPVPAATAVLLKNPNVRKALDFTAEYDKVSGDGSRLTMGCMVAQSRFLEEHPDAVQRFLERYELSVEEMLSDIDTSAELAAAYGITGNAKIAKLAIPDCSIVCITGEDMRPALDGYYKVLFEADPSSIGGSMPGDDFYYLPKDR